MWHLPGAESRISGFYKSNAGTRLSDGWAGHRPGLRHWPTYTRLAGWGGRRLSLRSAPDLLQQLTQPPHLLSVASPIEVPLCLERRLVATQRLGS